MRCYVGFLLCALALTATSVASAEDQPHFYSPVGQCPAIDGVFPVLLPDSEDPTIFYMCSHGTPYLKKCPPNTVFDVSLPGCKHKNQVIDDKEVPASYSPVGQCPQVDGEYPVYLPDSTNSTIFYECSNGTPVPLSCPAGLVFVPSKNSCTFPQAT